MSYARIVEPLSVIIPGDTSGFSGHFRLRPGDEIKNVKVVPTGYRFEVRRRSEHKAQTFGWCVVYTSSDLPAYTDKGREGRALKRGPKPSPGASDVLVSTRVTPEVSEELQRFAEANGMTVSAYARAVLCQAVTTKP